MVSSCHTGVESRIAEDLDITLLHISMLLDHAVKSYAQVINM